MASKKGAESWAITLAGAMLVAAASALDDADTATVPEPDVPRRPETSSFHFASTFQGEDALRTGEWVLSEDGDCKDQASRVRVEPCNLKGGRFATDYGLLLDESHKHYAVGATLPKAYDNSGKDLVVQYEVQVRGGPKCGGAYVKLLRGDAGEDMTTLNNTSPYSVMFGPDKCFRDTNKVHFIFQHENPVSKEWEEKHFKNAPKIKDDGGFHVYTLHVKTDNTFDLYLDAESVASGNLLEDVEPPVMPPKEIDDPEDEQPEDWVTQAKMDDPSASKPDDWDEDAPKQIVDEDAELPKGWLVDEEAYVADPSSNVPDDWDEEEDGEWEPVMMPNPSCEDAPGCGTWTKPLKPNPEYKGTWKAPKIDNPDYKGPWSPRRIANPNYFEEEHPSNMAPITGLAVEIWSVDGGVWMDNFVIGDDIGAALKLAEETWRPKLNAYEAVAAAEKKEKESEKAKKKKERDAALPSKLESASKFIVGKTRPYLPASVTPALDKVEQSPMAFIATLLAIILAMALMALRRASRPRPARHATPSAASASTQEGDGTADTTAASDADGNTAVHALYPKDDAGGAVDTDVDDRAEQENEVRGGGDAEGVKIGGLDTTTEGDAAEEAAPISSAN